MVLDKYHNTDFVRMGSHLMVTHPINKINISHKVGVSFTNQHQESIFSLYSINYVRVNNCAYDRYDEQGVAHLLRLAPVHESASGLTTQ